jgi:hypothetical protein
VRLWVPAASAFFTARTPCPQAVSSGRPCWFVSLGRDQRESNPGQEGQGRPVCEAASWLMETRQTGRMHRCIDAFGPKFQRWWLPANVCSTPCASNCNAWLKCAPYEYFVPLYLACSRDKRPPVGLLRSRAVVLRDMQRRVPHCAHFQPAGYPIGNYS